MKIGYPCINYTLDCTSSRTFRLASYSEKRLIDIVSVNLHCLLRILNFNLQNDILFFRLTSDLIPFASHPVMSVNWQEYFKSYFEEIGYYVHAHNMRISSHPDQFVLINSPDETLFQRSVNELVYHCDVFNLIGVDRSHKMQIHVGGVYGDKVESMKRFVQRYALLPQVVKERMVIENDDRLYSLQDCMSLYNETGVPVLFDTFHHSLLNNGESIEEAFALFTLTWKEGDGIPVIDYSSQAADSRVGKHSDSIVIEDFGKLLTQTSDYDYDIMLEIKDKEPSAIKAVEYLKSIGR